MSDTVTGLRRKIDGAGDLRSVVRTMKSIAASNITQYEKSVSSLEEYFRAVELGLGASLREAASVQNQSKSRPKRAVIGAIVFGSDQGLVGQFNDAIAAQVLSTLGADVRTARVWAVGERVQARLLEAGVVTTGLFAVPGSVTTVVSLVAEILLETETLRSHAEAAELYLFHNHPTNGAVYAPVSQRLLPLDAAWRAERMRYSWPTRNRPQVLGAGTTTLKALIGEYLFVSLFRACAESLASENASRLAAMQRAEKNIEEMLGDLKASFHRLRQGSIDEELFDVVSGFEALSG